jgi:uncharacterized membrane protein YccC
MKARPLSSIGRALEAESLRYGARLAAAVLLSFAVSALLRLPEGFWAVMSALIVVRPDTGSTLGAGWDRVRGALGGGGEPAHRGRIPRGPTPDRPRRAFAGECRWRR